MRSVRSLFVACLVTALTSTALVASPAFGMSLRTRLIVLAYSQDGQTALVEARVGGPEGGGQDVYELWSATAPYRERFELSSNLSPGDGSKPQAVDGKVCAARLGELDKALKKRGFKNVTVKPGACAARRDYLLTQKHHAEEVAESQFKATEKKLMHEGYEIRFMGQQITVMKEDTKLCTFSQPKREAPVKIVVRGTKGKLIFFVEESSEGDQGLLGMCGGEPMQLLPVR